MCLMIGNAPTSWGVEDAASPSNPPWTQVLAEVAEAGYSGIELGPYGYMPTGQGELRHALKQHRLTLTAGTLLDIFHDETAASRVDAQCRAICELLQANHAPYLVAISAISTSRVLTAGRSEAAERLDDSAWARLCATLNRIGEIAASAGISVTVHSHAGTHIEFKDELERVLEGTDPTMVGLCVDTGHAAYAGTDPVELVTSHAERVRYIHLKDVDPDVHSRTLADSMGFWDAYEAGVFCPLGEGMVDLNALIDALRTRGYDGWLTVEQDAHPSLSAEGLKRAKKSLAYLRGLGVP